MTRILAAGNALSAITLLAVALLVDQPPASHVIGLVVAAGNTICAVVGWRALRRKRAARSSGWPEIELVCESWTDQELLHKRNAAQRMANEGSPATLGEPIMRAIDAELRRRGVTPCACGAPLPDGIHTTHCEEPQ